MSRTEEIRAALVAGFSPQHLEVIDESEQHRGHSGYAEGGESHFRVVIRAPAFAVMSRLQRHRAIHAALGPQLIGRIHALALDVTG
ncbi:MAG: BolA family protein [Alphaproteobacteria bacterium]|jgi:BolA protein|nr:BolA family protein [Paracoccaceae bacterium]